MAVNSFRLIELVRKHPILYDITRSDFRDRTKKSAVWNIIASTLGVPAELCKCRWKNLKDVFVKEKRKLEQQVNGTSVKHKKKWRFYDKLTFLCGYMPVKDIGHNSSITSEDLLKEMQQSKETVVVPHLQEEETESLEISQNRDTFHGIKRKCPCINLKGPDKLHVISQVQDEEGHFGETVAAVLRRLTPYQRAVAKVKIQELLLHAEFNEKAVVPSHS